jgi:single-strand DNA-binding protein
MTGLNHVMLLGRLTRKPEVRTCANGVAFGSFWIAANRYYRDKNGQNREEVAFVPCAAFGRSAEQLAHKRTGDPVLVVGRLKTDSWQAEGVNHSRLVLIAEEVRFVSSTQALGQPEELKDSVSVPEDVRKAVPF